MADRRGARPVNQRRFEDAEPSAPKPEEAPEPVNEPAPEAPSAPAPARPPISREPCDRDLRARQLRWLRERERAG